MSDQAPDPRDPRPDSEMVGRAGIFRITIARSAGMASAPACAAIRDRPPCAHARTLYPTVSFRVRKRLIYVRSARVPEQ
jgi:hypothetical protein